MNRIVQQIRNIKEETYRHEFVSQKLIRSSTYVFFYFVNNKTISETN